MGLIDDQKDGDKQVVIFTIEGDMSPADRDFWNQRIAELKAKFPKVVGVTLVPKVPKP